MELPSTPHPLSCQKWGSHACTTNQPGQHGLGRSARGRQDVQVKCLPRSGLGSMKEASGWVGAWGSRYSPAPGLSALPPSEPAERCGRSGSGPLSQSVKGAASGCSGRRVEAGARGLGGAHAAPRETEAGDWPWAPGLGCPCLGSPPARPRCPHVLTARTSGLQTLPQNRPRPGALRPSPAWPDAGSQVTVPDAGSPISRALIGPWRAADARAEPSGCRRGRRSAPGLHGNGQAAPPGPLGSGVCSSARLPG